MQDSQHEMQAHNQGMNRRYETQLLLLQFKQYRKSDYIFRDELPRRNKQSARDITNNYRQILQGYKLTHITFTQVTVTPSNILHSTV